MTQQETVGLAKALQQSNISVTWVEQLDSRLASVHTTGKISWAAATRSIREWNMRLDTIGGPRIDTHQEVWGLDQTTLKLVCQIMRKSISALRQAGFESITGLPILQKSYRETQFVVIPLIMRICAKSNGGQRVQVSTLVVQGLPQKQ